MFVKLPERRGSLGAVALLVSALTFGGGGPHAPLLVAVIEAAALLVLLLTLTRADRDRVGAGGLTGLAFIVLVLIVGLLQLVPLPSAWWHALPGRGMLADTVALLDFAGQSRPLSLSPDDSRDALLAFLPPVAMFAATIHLGTQDRAILVRAAIAIGLVSAVLGFAQVAAGDGSFFPYGLPPYDRAPGLFSNFNHQALFLSAAFVLTVADGLERRGTPTPLVIARIGVLVTLALGAIVTSSRSGVALLGLAIVASGWLFLHSGGERSRLSGRRTRLVWTGAIAVLAVAVAALALSESYRSQMMVARFLTVSEDARLGFWPNVLYVIGLYFPAGSGLGTFDLVYQAAEPLSEVGPKVVNHAHNDYMELLIEAGAAGAALTALFLAWYVWRVAAALRVPYRVPGAITARAAAAVILFALLHSLVDYPLRTEALGCLFAMAAGLLTAPARGTRSAGDVTPDTSAGWNGARTI